MLLTPLDGIIDKSSPSTSYSYPIWSRANDIKPATNQEQSWGHVDNDAKCSRHKQWGCPSTEENAHISSHLTAKSLGRDPSDLNIPSVYVFSAHPNDLPFRESEVGGCRLRDIVSEDIESMYVLVQFLIAACSHKLNSSIFFAHSELGICWMLIHFPMFYSHIGVCRTKYLLDLKDGKGYVRRFWNDHKTGTKVVWNKQSLIKGCNSLTLYFPEVCCLIFLQV